MADRYPIDFDQLQRGDVIPAETVEAYSGLHRDDKRFNFELMSLAEDIRRHFRECHGLTVSVRQSGGDLCVLTNEQQAHYTRQQEILRMRRYLRTCAEGLAVDLAQLSEEQRDKHEKFQLRIGWQQQQMTKRPPPSLTE